MSQIQQSKYFKSWFNNKMNLYYQHDCYLKSCLTRAQLIYRIEWIFLKQMLEFSIFFKHAMKELYKILSAWVQKLVNKSSLLLQYEKQEMKHLTANFSSILEKLVICYTFKNTWFEKLIIKLFSHTHCNYIYKIFN